MIAAQTLRRDVFEMMKFSGGVSTELM
jgi:hypothetical protein